MMLQDLRNFIAPQGDSIIVTDVHEMNMETQMTQDTVSARKQGSFPANDPMQGLIQDHHYVRQLMQRYLSTHDLQVKQQAGPHICEILGLHTSLEEATFYPRVQVLDSALVERCLDDHQQADQLMKQMQNLEPGIPEYDELMQKLHDCIVEHVTMEEEQLFPIVRDSSLDLHEMALQMQLYESNLVAAQASQSAQQTQKRP